MGDDNTCCYRCDLLDDSITLTQPKDVAVRHAQGLSQWLETFSFPTWRRKNPGLTFYRQGNTVVIIKDVNAGNEDEQQQDSFQEHWKKQISVSLKKIVVDDLGNMNAIELYESIPLEDSSGRGKSDLEKLEKQISVKVVFCDDGHVLLVGQKQKLEKKCFVLRNVLSHYHWRLSGKDVALGSK